MRILGIIAVVFLAQVANAFDMRSMVAGPGSTLIEKTIDPNSSIFGIPFGTTEDNFISTFGSPTGYLRISRADTAMIYGKSHLFFFREKRLSGVRITTSVIDWVVANEISVTTPFDSQRWELSNGLTYGMSQPEVKRILGERLKFNHRGYQAFYLTERSKVDLEFMHSVGQGEDDSAYSLSGITVRQKNANKAKQAGTP